MTCDEEVLTDISGTTLCRFDQLLPSIADESNLLRFALSTETHHPVHATIPLPHVVDFGFDARPALGPPGKRGVWKVNVETRRDYLPWTWGSEAPVLLVRTKYEENNHLTECKPVSRWVGRQAVPLERGSDELGGWISWLPFRDSMKKLVWCVTDDRRRPIRIRRVRLLRATDHSHEEFAIADLLEIELLRRMAEHSDLPQQGVYSLRVAQFNLNRVPLKLWVQFYDNQELSGVPKLDAHGLLVANYAPHEGALIKKF